jgi:hypothetical protein
VDVLHAVFFVQAPPTRAGPSRLRVIPAGKPNFPGAIVITRSLCSAFMFIDIEQRPLRTTSPAATIRTRSPHYFPEIDGIRAIAVLMVLFCHARLTKFTGGFVGVDLFFVISGYVVTLGISRQQEADRFTLSNFYACRLRRLLPALYTVALATLAFCLLFSFPENTFRAPNKTSRARRIGEDSTFVRRDDATQPWGFCKALLS